MMHSILRYLPIFVFFFLTACQNFTGEKVIDEAAIRQEILDNGQAIRDAFLDQDIEKIKSLHHPDVIKALGYHNVQTGREAVIEGLKETLQNVTLEFVENDVEHLFVQEDLVIEQTKFAIKGTPKDGGDSFVFKGRTMVTYVRYADSPTGWATIREIIQPATE